jgi:hypothetical protein
MAKNTETNNEITALKPSDLIVTIMEFMKHRAPFLLKGSPGIGKTDIICQAAKNMGYDIHISHPVVSDPVDYKGMPTVVEGEAMFLPFGDLKKLINATKPTVFFLDDLGQASPAVQAACMQLLLSRSIDGKKISDMVTFAAATNNKSDKAAVSGILEPVKSRFVSIMSLRVDIDDWIDWASKPSDVYKEEPVIPPTLIAFIKKRPNMLMDFNPTNDITNSPVPRTVANVGKILRMNLGKHARLAVIEGAVGRGFTAEYLAFEKICDKLPDPVFLLKNPEKMPTINDEDMDILYALAISLAFHVTKDLLDNYMKIIEQMPKEYGVTSMIQAAKTHENIAATKQFMKWNSANKGVITGNY